MPKFLIFTHLSPQGRKHVRHDPTSLPDISAELSGVDAKVVAQYAMLGPQDFLTIVDGPVPLDGFSLAIAAPGAQGIGVPMSSPRTTSAKCRRWWLASRCSPTTSSPWRCRPRPA